MSEIRSMEWSASCERDYFGTNVAILRLNGFALGKVERHDSALAGKPKDEIFWGSVASYEDSTGRPNGTRVVKICTTEAEARAVVEARFREILPTWLDCRECGAPNDPSGYYPKMTAKLRAACLCFGCNFWEEYVTEGKGVIVAGVHYMVGNEAEVAPARQRNGGWGLGCGGAKHEIEFLADSRRVVTHNLWVQGTIPVHFRDRLPDNARFIRPEEKDDGVRYPFVGQPLTHPFERKPG